MARANAAANKKDDQSMAQISHCIWLLPKNSVGCDI
jgi:hypothetical protein